MLCGVRYTDEGWVKDPHLVDEEVLTAAVGGDEAEAA